ncbi:hypothetical protein PF011_g20692, partial [Phytophthora fragariae]
MARHNSPSAFSTQRIAAPYAGRGNRNKTVASVAPCKKQMAVINWENVLAPLDWMAVYLGLGRDNSAVEAAVVRCRSSPDLLQSLAAIEERTMQLLTETMRLVDGPVFIVSEYSTSYVELVSSLFFPRLTAALRSASTGIYVVGTPNTQLTALEMKQWKVNLLHTAILEYLFAGIDEVAATNLLARSAYGRIKVVALCANEMDTTAASGVRLIAPIAVIRHVRVQCPKARAPGRSVNYSSKFGSTPTAKSVLMTTLTPTRTKAATKSGKTKRVTRRQTKDLLMQSEDDDGASHSEGGEQAGDGQSSQDPPQPKVTRPAESEEEPTAEDTVPTSAPETPTALNEERTAAAETARRIADASPTPDEHRADEPTAAAPATEVAALASALYQLTTV